MTFTDVAEIVKKITCEKGVDRTIRRCYTMGTEPKGAVQHHQPDKLKGDITMKKSISVSNLTLDLWLDFVRPALQSVNMLDEVPAKDEWHEYTAEVIDAETAKEITHCMTVACFNAHAANEFISIEEAKQMLYQIDVSIEYRTDTREDLQTLREALAAKIAETTEELKGDNTMTTTITAIAAIIDLAQEMKNAYFFAVPSNARARRAYEYAHSIPTVEWDEGGHHYTAEYTTSCSCSNVYAKGSYTRDGKPTTLTAIRNSYRRMTE